MLKPEGPTSVTGPMPAVGPGGPLPRRIRRRRIGAALVLTFSWAAILAYNLIALALNLWLAPLAGRALRNELFHVRTDFAASLIRLGEFTEPTIGTLRAQKDVEEYNILKENALIKRDTEKPAPIPSSTT